MKKLKNKAGQKVVIFETPKEARRFVSTLIGLRKKLRNGVALDFETTSLKAEEGEVRLTSISYEPGKAYIIDHWLCGSFASFADDLVRCGPFYVFNSGFEGRWFDYNSEFDVELLDVGHMRRSVQGGGPLSLAVQIKWDLGVSVSKELQDSDWTAMPLSNAQYFYAGLDSVYTLQLGMQWSSEMTLEHWNGFRFINNSWRAVAECEDTGLKLNIDHHRKLIRMWTARRNVAYNAFRRIVPEKYCENIRSKPQISKLLRMVLDADAIEAWPKTDKTKQLKTDRNIMRQMSYASPYPFSRMLAALMVFNRADKYLSTYGEPLITKQELSRDDRVRGRLNIAQAVTGRFSSSQPNMQNIPRAPLVRRSFIAGDGHKLILADYSGIEVRVLAEMSKDKVLLHDAIYDDVHSRSAIAIYKQGEDDFMARIEAKDPAAKEMRAKAKGFTFQLLYGAGPPALAIVLRSTPYEAEQAIAAWAKRYQRAYDYRFYMEEKMNNDGYLPTQSGRTIYVSKRDRSLPVAANYPVQGSAGDVMYAAMKRCHDALSERLDIRCKMMVTVHDELLLVAEEGSAEGAKELLEETMVQGWLDVFPDTNTDNLVEAVIGDHWGAKA